MIRTFTQCEIQFNHSGPFYHIYTSPLENEIIFRNIEEYIIITNLIAIAITQSNCRILVYAIMSNHLHFILEGTETDCLLFFELLKNSLNRYLKRHGRPYIVEQMTPGKTEITNLKQLRDEIAYVIRNPFVVREDVNPLAYPWCTGYLYFNPFLDTGGISVSKLKTRELRAFTSSRLVTNVDSSILVKDGCANPASFVDYKRAMLFFDNARQFVMNMYKNVEAQVEVAKRYGEVPHLNDEEMFSLSLKICREMFKVNYPRDLDYMKQKQLAVILKNDYGGSNAQVARCTSLSVSEVNAMFPLAARNKR
ncbi:MAG: hypothetical protein J6X57_02935 [Bacteroidales bacterium]|nr:hypothetical protein [Bacteroidales bacterium]